jgi:DOMON domain
VAAAGGGDDEDRRCAVRRRAATAAGLMVAAGVPAQAARELTRLASAAGVEFRWALDGRLLHGCMRARTRGWITVGFNTQPTLDGARLVMGRVLDGKAQIEVHRARPPHHVRIAGSDEVVRVAGGAQEADVTRVCFVMPLDPIDPSDVTLVPGSPTHLVLAWSHEPDFNHHSADRGALNVLL